MLPTLPTLEVPRAEIRIMSAQWSSRRSLAVEEEEGEGGVEFDGEWLGEGWEGA